MMTNAEKMKDMLVSLSKKNKNNIFLKNKIEMKCTCGHSESITYYDFLSGGEFSIGKTTQTISPFISEYIYEETINITPLNLSKKCPECKKEIVVVFPLSLEDILSILQSQPDDMRMYG